MATTTTRKNNLPAFVEATYANLARAIVDKKFDTGVYAYLTDKEMFCYVTAAGAIHIVKGLNWQIQNVTELPDVDDGNKEVLYIMDGDIYTFNGTEYVLSYQKLQDQVDALSTNLEDNYYKSSVIDTKLGSIIDDEGNEIPVSAFVLNQIEKSLTIKVV